MRIGITTNDDRGLDSEVSAHFGQCKYFCVVELNGNKIKEAKVAQNTAVHGGGGCQAVDEMMKHGVNKVGVVISISTKRVRKSRNVVT